MGKSKYALENPNAALKRKENKLNCFLFKNYDASIFQDGWKSKNRTSFDIDT